MAETVNVPKAGVEKRNMTEAQQPFVVSIILNTNRREDTLECLQSLKKSSYARHKVLVMDNSSTDGSLESIRSSYPDIRIIQLEQNLGYAGNNNVGIHAALEMGADWVFILNEDVVLDDDTIAQLIAEAEKDELIGVLGPLVYHYDDPIIIQSAGGILTTDWSAHHRGENLRDDGQFTIPEEVDWISGCAILVRKEAIELIGGLDERFFYYWEETEWCTRARLSGWKVLNVPAAKLWHKGVQQNYQPSPNITYYWTRNWLLFLVKHHAPLRAWIATLYLLTRTLISWTLRKRWKRKREHRDAMWQGMMDFVRRRWGMRVK